MSEDKTPYAPLNHIRLMKEHARIQELVDSLLTFPQYAQYVKTHKLKLIDSRLAEIDELLDLGIVKA